MAYDVVLSAGGGDMETAVQPELVEATAGQLEDARRIIVAANECYRTVLDAAAFDPYLAMALDLESRLRVATVLLLRHGGSGVGTVTFYPDARDEGWGGPADVAGIRSMGVDPSAQGRGVGAALVAECVRRAHAAGADAIALHTAEWLPAAIRLYERCGFVRDPARDIRASDVMELPADLDYTGLAYRLDLR